LNERHRHFFHCHWILSSLEIDVSDAGWAKIEEKLDKFFSLVTIPLQPAVVAPHATVGTPVAAEIGDLHDGAHENLRAKSLAPDCGSTLKEPALE
jgi:hypothetical protein